MTRFFQDERPPKAGRQRWFVARTGLVKSRREVHTLFMIGRDSEMTGAPTATTGIAPPAAEQGERQWR